MKFMKTQTYGKTANIRITNKTHLVQAVAQMKRLLLLDVLDADKGREDAG